MCLHGPVYLLERTKSPQATAQVLDFVHLSDAAEAIVLGEVSKGPSMCIWVLGPSWEHLGPSWGHLRTILGYSGPILAGLWHFWSSLGTLLGHLGAILDHLKAILKESWTILKPKPNLSDFRVDLEPFGNPFWRSFRDQIGPRGAKMGPRGPSRA